jgi:hypothetical protein
MFWNIFLNSLLLILAIIVIGQGIAKILSSHEESEDQE